VLLEPCHILDIRAEAILCKPQSVVAYPGSHVAPFGHFLALDVHQDVEKRRCRHAGLSVSPQSDVSDARHHGFACFICHVGIFQTRCQRIESGIRMCPRLKLLMVVWFHKNKNKNKKNKNKKNKKTRRNKALHDQVRQRGREAKAKRSARAKRRTSLVIAKGYQSGSEKPSPFGQSFSRKWRRDGGWVTTTFRKELGPHASVEAMVYEASCSVDDGSVAGKENGADVETAAAARAAGMLVCCC